MKKQKKWFLALLLFCGACATTEVYTPEVGEGYYVLTPKQGDCPRINGAEIFGVKPGAPFLYTIPVTGKRPMTFSANNLPEGLSLNTETGIITGSIISPDKKSYKLIFYAENESGRDEKPFEIKVGDDICLTPPLGWNSWNCWGSSVTQENVEASAQAMCDKGLIDYGWSYVNIDDGWQGNYRGGEFYAIQPDSVKFPDIKSMVNKIHEMGLKAGIYSTPWGTSYAHFIGGSSHTPDGKWDKSMVDPKGTPANERKYQAVGPIRFDENDARQWAAWGIDYLKYDWNPNDSASTVNMSLALKNSGRDIVFSLSNTCPMDLSPICEKYVQCWRTTGDLKDRWSGRGNHKSIWDVWQLHRTWIDSVFCGSPGHFPDPDMLVVGNVDHGAEGMTASRLTPDEQYSHITLWSLWSAPMLIGCPVEQLDDFTLALLTNSEVLDVQQDKLGIAGKSVIVNDSTEVIVKKLADGSKAVGLFNLASHNRVISANWDILGLQGKHLIRDIWRQEDIGLYNNAFIANVPAHGVVFIKIFEN